MKRLALIVSLLSPLAATAQFVVFTDNFNAGSTTNHLSVPGGTPFASFTSYDIAATKAAITNCPIQNGEFRITIDGNSGTGSGFLEAQAVFTKNPVTLVNIGDSITLSYVFRMTNAFAAASSYIGQGLYNSGGVPPLPGSLVNSGLGGSSFATGNCQLWQGMFSRFFSNVNCVCISRPVQNGGGGTAAANQDLLGTGVTGGFTSPAGGTFAGTTNSGTFTFTTGQYYTITMTIALGDTNTPTLLITNSLYPGAGTSGTALIVMTNAATGTNFQTTFDSLALGRRDSGGSALPISMVVTNITISENLQGLPGQPFDVTGGGAGCPGNVFPVGLDGSVTTNNYYVFTNGTWNGVVMSGTGSALSFPPETMLSVPLTNTILASNTISAITGFMIGSAILSPNSSTPVITNQPFPVIVANGSIGVFSVGASGGGLTYQWFKNGGALSDVPGHISGTTTPTLVISPVGAGDAAPTAAGYFCVVTSGCGQQAPTSTNSLTIGSPVNLTWQGGNPGSNWDLSVTANFLSGATPAVFHNGDNVSFTDSTGVSLVSVANNFIAPTILTESAAESYIFVGPGVITGPGSVVMSGSGSLSMSSSNGYTGGTTINSGEVIVSNLFALGSGTITLKGGTFDLPITPGSAVGMSNNINVTGTSTLQYDKTGTFGCVLNGALSGVGGNTLTLSCSSAATGTARVRMYGQFTNNADVVISSAGTEMEWASYNPAGNQLWTGNISGIGGHIITRGAGTITLANSGSTFTDTTGPSPYSVLMSSGNLGIGADSTPAVPPITSSPIGGGMLGINVGSEGGNCSFFASGGAHTIGNQIQYTASSNTVNVIFSGANNLTFSGQFDLSIPGSAVDTNAVQRIIEVTNTAATIFAGTLDDNSANGGLAGITKTGVGALYLNGTNIYGGPTTNAVGLLAGTGSVASAVVVSNGASIGGGSASSIGTFTVSNSLSLGGNVFVRVNKSLAPAQSNDMVNVTGTLANAGTGSVNVTNVGGGSLAVGDKYFIFNKAVANGAAMTVTGGGMNWNNNLGVDGSIVAASTATGPATNPTNMVVHVSGTNLSITWPGDHLGWFLQMQTNLTSSPWTDVPGSASVTNVLVPIVPGAPRAFFRMSLQP